MSVEYYSKATPEDKNVRTTPTQLKSECATEQQDNDDNIYPSSWKLALITIALSLAVFCMALDNTIIATAIPAITNQFKSLDDVGWYGSAYLLTTCTFQLSFGKLYTFYSVKWVFIIALAIFEIGSLICGVAPNSEALIIGRAIAGIGSAGIFSGAILIIALTVPLARRAAFTGLIGGMYGLASVGGPLLGGAFTDNLSWRWCFYINLPFGAVTAVFLVLFYSEPKRKDLVKSSFKEMFRQLDPIGFALFAPGIISLLLALQWGGSKYAWNNARIIVLLTLFGTLMMGFVGVQIWKKDIAMVPPRVFKNRNVWGSALFSIFLGAGFFIMVYYLPVWFQAVKGDSATQSGVHNIPMILGLVIMSVISGGLVTRYGYYTPFIYGSVIFMSVGAGLLTTLEPDTNSPKWIGFQVVYGFGVGMGMQQALMAVQTALPPADVPVGTAIVIFAQILGGAVFISVAQNVLSNQLTNNLTDLIPNFDPSLILHAGATELRHNPSLQAFLPQILKAYNDSLTETWYAVVAVSVLSVIGALFIEWKSMKNLGTMPMHLG